MKKFDIKPRAHWKVLKSTARSQGAIMVIPPGSSEGGKGNRHPKSDQWLYVISGNGQAIVGGKKVSLKPKTLLLIEKNIEHQILNTSAKNLSTINFYSPPAY